MIAPLVGHARIIAFFERLPLLAVLIVAGGSAAMLAGWEMGTVYPGARFVMLPWTSILFFCAAVSLGLLCLAPQSRIAKYMAITLALFIACFALAVVMEYALQRDFGIDLSLYRDLLLRSRSHPLGRIALNSVVGFTFMGIALLMIPIDDGDLGNRAQWVATIPLMIGFLAVIGYVFGVKGLYSLSQYSGMAWVTAVMFVLISLGIVFARPRRGIPGLLVDSGAAGMLTRRLLPAAVFFPFTFGWLFLAVERMDLYDTAFGIALFALVLTMVLLYLVASSARVIRVFDRERAELLAREQEARETAEGASMAKSNFLAVMSHELRTPLSAIIGYEELLADGITGPVNDAQRHQLGRVKASAQHLLQIIDQILTYSRIDAGREVVHATEVDANELAQDAASLVEPLAIEKGLQFAVIPLDYPVAMSTDAGKVRQILVNLLSNAVKFTARGQVSLSVHHDGGKMRYVVRDTGIGIAPEHQDHIFEAFWQVEQSATRRVGGTGLGLSVTRRLARLLGGDVTVQSAPGHGSTFTVTIPLQV